MMKLFHMGIYEGFAEKEQDQKGYRGGEEWPFLKLSTPGPR